MFITIISVGKESARLQNIVDPFSSAVDTRAVKHQASRSAGLWLKEPPPQPQLRISLQFLGNRQFRVKRNRGSCRRRDNCKHGANVQDAGIRSSSGALFPPHFYLLALFWHTANWASVLGCVGAHLRIYPCWNPILMCPSMLRAEEVAETGGIMASKPNSHRRDRSCNHSKSGQRVRMQSWSSGGQR